MAQTKLENLINPQVMGDMIQEKLPSQIKVSPFAKIDTSLVGVPGNTITVPQYAYIGDAEDVAEGVAMGTTVLTASTTTATIKKVGKAVDITDEAVLSGYGNPVGNATSQLTKSIASKIDNDSMDAIGQATLVYDGTAAIINYNAVVSAVDLFEEEDQMPKVIFVNPKQVTQIRKDTTFQDINKYPITQGVVMTGVIGQIAGCQTVPSKKVRKIGYEKDNVNGTVTISTSNIATYQSQVDYATNLVVGDKVKALTTAYYGCPIVKLESEPLTDDSLPALTIYMKKDVSVETDRDILKKTTTISADEHYTASLSNASKVVLGKFKAA